MSAHWGFEDPAAVHGSDADKRKVFEQLFKQIMATRMLLVREPAASHARPDRASSASSISIGKSQSAVT